MKAGNVYLEDGTLAGSTVTLGKAIKNPVEKVNIPFDEAIRMANLNPARVLGLDHRKGVLSVGRDADIVILSREYEVEMTIMEGKICFDTEILKGRA